MFMAALIILPPGWGLPVVKAAEEDTTTESNTIFTESFDNGQGAATQSGGPTLEVVNNKVFDGNENGNALYISGRSNDYDAIDFNFETVGMEDGKTYLVTVAGYVDDGTDLPEGAQAAIKTNNTYADLNFADFEAGEAFQLQTELTVGDSDDTAFRIQSNGEGATVPFYVGHVEVAELITAPPTEDEDTEEPQEPEEEDGNVVFSQSFEDDELGNWQNLPWAESNGAFEISTDQASDGSKSLLFKERENRNSSPSLNLTDKVEPGYKYNISLKVRVSEGTDTLRIASKVEASSLDNNYPWIVSNQEVSSTDWTSFEATGFSLPTDTSEFILYVESDDNGSENAPDIFIDEVIITQVGEIDSTPDEDETEDPDREPALEFETITFEDGEYNGFEPRGGNEVLTVTDEANHTEGGSKSLKVENREQDWNGPSLNIEQYIDRGAEYEISAWVKLISPGSASIDLSAQIGSSDYGPSYPGIASATATADEWVLLQGTYRFSSVADDYVTIYVQSSIPDATFYIDDISIVKTDSAPSEPTEIEDLTPLKDIYNEHFLIGNAVSSSSFEGVELDLLTKHHNLVTAENVMKPESYYNNGEFTSTAADSFLQRAVDNNFDIHGHVLLWHSQSEDSLYQNPDGSYKSREEALANMHEHIENVMRSADAIAGDKLISWDVVNEALDGDWSNPEDWKSILRPASGWLQSIGDDYIYEAFLKARQVADELGRHDMILYYNDYNDHIQPKAKTMYHMVKDINERYAAENPNDDRKLISGVGMQAHYTTSVNIENVRESLERFISLGVEVGVTELDVGAGGSNLTPAEELQQAYFYAQLFQLYKEHSDHISRVTLWGLSDGHSWRSENSPLLFDGNLQAKQAYYALTDTEKFIEENAPEEVLPEEGVALYGTPTIDGQIDDIWNDAVILNINKFQDAHNTATGQARVLWDEENLYVLAEVNDTQLDKTSANAHEQDSVEVFIDEQNTKAASYGEGHGQYRVNFDNEASFNPDSISEGFESQTVVNGTSYLVEMKIPLKTVDGQDNHVIGFDIQINDAVDGARRGVTIWNDLTGMGWSDPSVFGVLTLVNSLEEPEPVDPEPTPEEPKEPEVPGEELVVIKPKVNNKVATVDNSAVESIKKDGTLVLDLEDNNSTVKVSLTKEQVSKLKEQNAEIVIVKEDVIVEIPASLLTNGDEAVEINVERMKDIKEALSPVYDFTIVQDGKTISNFDTPVTLTFPVDADRVNNPDDVKVFYWNPETEAWEQVGDGGYYQDGYITVETDHFSTFTVFEIADTSEVDELPAPTPVESDPETPVNGDGDGTESDDETSGDDSATEDDESSEDGDTLPDTATSTYNFLLAGLVMLLAGSLVFFVRRKKA